MLLQKIKEIRKPAVSMSVCTSVNMSVCQYVCMSVGQ